MESADYICPICLEHPGSHSFHKLKETADGISIFYTCPSKAIRHNDHDGIINHYEGVMGANNNKPWIWIFDCQGFSLKHAMEIQISVSLAKLINEKYSHNLQKIIITNPTWHIHTTLALVKPFLSERILNLIHISPVKLKTQ